MRFINKGESIKIRQGSLRGEYKWITLEKGEKIDLPKDVGIRNGLEFESNKMLQNVTTSKAGPKVVETKQFEDQYTADDLFFKELTKIKGIGPKMAKDIVVWGTKEKLIDAIKLKAELPFRDDVEEKLKRAYGK